MEGSKEIKNSDLEKVIPRGEGRFPFPSFNFNGREQKLNKGKILIFKDESDNQEILKVRLRSMKYKILDAPEEEKDQEILVVITGYLDKGLEASIKAIGAKDFLVKKPVEKKKLMETIDKYFKR